MNPLTLLRIAALCLLAAFVFTSCAHNKDEDGIPPKYKARAPRDPVEQRVFYDGWPHLFGGS